MPEPTDDAAAQGDATPPTQGVTPPAQGAAATGAQGAPPATAGDGVVTVESLQAKVAELERDNRAYRQRTKADADAAKAKAEGDMPELERLRTQHDELKASNAELTSRLQEQSLRVASSDAAGKLGFRNPGLAHRLLDAKAVTYDDAGVPTNVEDLLKALAKSDPYLLSATDFGGGNRGASASPPANDMNAIIRGAAAKRT